MNTPRHEPSDIDSGSTNLDGIEQIHEQVLHAVRGVRFGSVEITVHDGKVVQIERKEKIRFGNSAPRHNA